MINIHQRFRHNSEKNSIDWLTYSGWAPMPPTTHVNFDSSKLSFKSEVGEPLR